MYIEKNNKGVTKNKLIDYWMNNIINENIKLHTENVIIKKDNNIKK